MRGALVGHAKFGSSERERIPAHRAKRTDDAMFRRLFNGIREDL
jgi:hypothetical protein